VLLTATSVSVAAADEGPGRQRLGVTRTAPPSPRADRVGVLLDGDRRHFCTASVVHSPRHDLVVTAAHCVDGGGTMWFAPGYRDGTAPYGVWRVRDVFYDDAWADGADEDHDLAFAVLEGDGRGRGVEDVVGAFGADAFGVGRSVGAGVVTVVGYPDARETPVACTNRPTLHSPTQRRIHCPDFTGGTSGSPWVDRAGEVVGVIGGYEEGGATADVSYSVVLGEDARRLYRTVMAQ
jgi:V8-like Glu-specific endopeptidase